MGWYETDEAGNQISNVPFNFATQITKDTYLKAIFRKEGTFQVRYLPNMGTEGTDEYVAGDPNTAPPTDTYTYIDLSEAKVGHSIEPADDKHQFAGWRVKGTTGPVYQPGETFPINSDYAEEDGGIQFITLEPVFIQKGDTSISYEVNIPTGGTATGTSLTDLTNNTQDKLILDGSVTLHDGNGFTVTGYKLIGWSDEPLQPSTNPIHLNVDGTFDGIVPSDTHLFKLGGKYGVSDEEGNTLYAVWELLTIPVSFTKQGENNLGGYDQLAGVQFKLYTDADCQNLISDVYNEIDEPEAVIISSDEDGSNVVFPKVPVGTFYFKETAVGDQYKLDSTVHKIEVTESDDGNHTLSYTIDGSYTSATPLVIKNDLKGTLVITKTVVGPSRTRTFSFTATLSDSSVNGKYGDLTFENGIATFALAHDGEIKIRNLAGKEITIAENNAAAYTTTASAESEGGSYNQAAKSFTITIPEDGDTVAFTNTLEAQKLRIKKIGDDAPSGLADATFSLIGSGVEGFTDMTGLTSMNGEVDPASLGYLPSGDETDPTLFTLPIGNYILTEADAPQYYDGIGAVSLKVTEDGISITKVGEDEEAPFDGADIDVTDGIYTLTVTNIRKPGTLVIRKATVSTDIANEKLFRITIQNSAGQYLQNATDISFSDTAPENPLTMSVKNYMTIENLPVGTYTVKELTGNQENDTSFVAINGYRYDDTEYSSETAVVNSDETTNYTITNNYTKLVDVTVTKTLVDTTTTTGTKEFAFTAALTEDENDITSRYLGAIEEGQTVYSFTMAPSTEVFVTKTFTGIPVGAVLTVTEAEDIGYSTTVSVGDGEASSENTGILTVEDNDNNTIAFTNTRKTTSIKIKKEDNNGNELPGAEFNILSLDSLRPTLVTTLKAGDKTLADGIIAMASIAEIKLSNLPAGHYKLVETHAPDGYVILSSGIDFSVVVSGERAVITLDDVTREDATVSGDTITVKNTPGVALPSTGGSGTNLLYLLGIMLTGFAGAGFVMRRRRRYAA